MKYVLIMIALLFFGCEKDATSDVEPKTNDAVETKEKTEKPENVEQPATGKVALSKAGQKFDPAIKPEQLPAGAWYCDMGTVHWAAVDKPADGKCPECGMMLKQYDAEKLDAQKEKAVEAKPDEHGHDHDENSDHEH